MNHSARDRVLWTITLAFGAFAAFKTPVLSTPLVALVPMVSIVVPTLFALLHGSRRLGWRAMGVLFVVSFAISWTMESSSIATGFPFGHYHYTAKLGPKLGTVPLLIMPAYFSMCYVSWNLAHILLDHLQTKPIGVHKFAIPVVAAFVMVMWDLSMDPSRATVAQAWIWHDGGSYFGVPFVNFMGWYLTVYLIFQSFSLLLPKVARTPTTEKNHDGSRVAWHLNTAFYFATFIEFVALIAVGTDRSVTDAAGVVWSTKAMYESLGLVSIFTMCFVTVLAYFKVRLNPNLR